MSQKFWNRRNVRKRYTAQGQKKTPRRMVGPIAAAHLFE